MSIHQKALDKTIENNYLNLHPKFKIKNTKIQAKNTYKERLKLNLNLNCISENYFKMERRRSLRH